MSNKKHKIKYGLKLWSTDSSLFREAIELLKKGQIDFIEIYIVPDSFTLGQNSILNIFKNIPTTIHATHMEHGFDVFKLDNSKVEFFKNQIIKTADFLKSKFIVVHAEAGDSEKLFKENIKKINDPRILIENMPKFGLEGETCFAHNYAQLKFIRNCGFNFCLDFGHAINSATNQNIDYKKFIEKLIFNLNPCYFHICNGKLGGKEDHRDLFDGEFDIKWIKETLLGLAEKKDIYLVFETPKGKNSLENDIKNIEYFISK
ncbi:MAG: TIM barrel protein [bacterium]